MTDNNKDSQNKSLSSSVFSLLKSLAYKYAPLSLAFFGLFILLFIPAIMIADPKTRAGGGLLLLFTFPAGTFFILIALIWDHHTSKVIKDNAIMRRLFKVILFLLLILIIIYFGRPLI